MNEQLQAKYTRALHFWNETFALNEEGREKYLSTLNPETDCVELASSEKLYRILLENMAGCQKVLDYGCGRGWAGLSLKKAGCETVEAVDLSENAAESARFLAGLLGISHGYDAHGINRDWLSAVPAERYDGIVCSNVLDVIPTQVAREILAQFRRIAKKGAVILIGMNYYMEPKDNPERKIVIEEGNQVMMDGILRMVTRTDEEWAAILGEYFTVEALDHFGWKNEQNERRRVFVLKQP